VHTCRIPAPLTHLDAHRIPAPIPFTEVDFAEQTLQKLEARTAEMTHLGEAYKQQLQEQWELYRREYDTATRMDQVCIKCRPDSGRVRDYSTS
jgi:hypothetical protein